VVGLKHFKCMYLSNVYRKEVKETQKRQRNRKIKRYALVGLATLSGGAILGLTGGLAAPLIGMDYLSNPLDLNMGSG